MFLCGLQGQHSEGPHATCRFQPLQRDQGYQRGVRKVLVGPGGAAIMLLVVRFGLGFILLLTLQDISDGGDSQESTSSSGALEDLMQLTVQKPIEVEAKFSQERFEFMKEKKAEGYSIDQINRAWIKKQRDDADELGGEVEFKPSAQYKNAAKKKNPKPPTNPENDGEKKIEKEKNKKKASKAKPPVVSSTYAPGTFKDARLSFMRKKRAKGFTHLEACKLWMCSNKRAAMLSDLPVNELKRRRFA